MFPAINLHNFLEKLAENSWVEIPLDLNFALRLAECAERRLGDFRPATISADRRNESTIRSDSIFWLDEHTSDLKDVEKEVLESLEMLRNSLRDYFRIGLVEFECHFSNYTPGQAYIKHVDCTPQNNRRFFSFVIYLNPNWKSNEGGQIVGYHQDRELFRMNPEAGRMVVFRSDLEHEVLVAHRSRFALTGWMRK